MDKEKVVVILLLITIILSIGSIIFTFSVNYSTDDIPQRPVRINPSSTNQANVGFTLTEPKGGTP